MSNFNDIETIDSEDLEAYLTKLSFFSIDLKDIEKTFLPEGTVVTDLPIVIDSKVL